MPPSHLAVLVGTVVSAVSAAAAPPLDQQYAAAARMHTWVLAAEGLHSKCAGQFPEIRERIGQDLASWELRDQAAIKRANDLWAEMQATSPRSREEAQADTAHLEALWANLLQSSSPEEECLSYFNAHASGVLRKRWPEVFEALEER
jgi:hypothetical protein